MNHRAAERHWKIRWDELGQPTQPCVREYNGDLIDVRQRDIDLARGNPDAVFAVSRFRLWTGPEYYRLGKVQLPSPVSEARSQSYDGARHVLIRWSDLGSPRKPGRFAYRGSIVDVQEKDIAAARDNSAAVFMATRLRPYIGSSYYVLGKVDFPEDAAPTGYDSICALSNSPENQSGNQQTAFAPLSAK